MAAAATATLSTFPQFMNLALELRNQIWRDALPDKIDPTLCFFKKGCWHPLHLTESDPYHEYDPRNVFNLRLEFSHELLDVVQVRTPLVSVNHEARSIAVAWAREQGFVIKEDKGCPLFGRPFNPKLDILYVRKDEGLLNFWLEPADLPFDHPDFFDRNYSIRSFVENFAFSEDTLQEFDLTFEAEDDNSFVADLSRIFPVKMLFIVVDAPQELDVVDVNLEMRQPWQLESTRGGEYILDCDNHTYQFHGTKYASKEELYKILEKSIRHGLRIKDVDHNFKVLPTSVMRN
ncbi:hypothetical protein NHQ30_005027 [Ciborinia camelliae]|nr:hypothetical protein NHQ30_005027 [Ciborinia camelliae]